MVDWFQKVIHSIPRQGPGCVSSTVKAWGAISKSMPANPNVLDIGCGAGASTLCLATQGPMIIVAVDNDGTLLTFLRDRAGQNGLSNRIKPVKASMFDLPFNDNDFDLIWSEGAIYIIGFDEGLDRWKQFLKPSGFMVISEMSWLNKTPPDEAVAYMEEAYPVIRSIQDNLASAESRGYKVIDHFVLPGQGWTSNYYDPIKKQMDLIEASENFNPDAAELFIELRQEIDIYERFNDAFGYVFYILQK